MGDQDTSVVDLIRVLVQFCQYESCGKCFPCRLGTTHLLEILERMCLFQSLPGDMELMKSVGQNMAAGSLCGHGQLGFNPVESALMYFGSEFAAHMEERRCPAGSCGNPILAPERTRR